MTERRISTATLARELGAMTRSAARGGSNEPDTVTSREAGEYWKCPRRVAAGRLEELARHGVLVRCIVSRIDGWGRRQAICGYRRKPKTPGGR